MDGVSHAVNSGPPFLNINLFTNRWSEIVSRYDTTNYVYMFSHSVRRAIFSESKLCKWMNALSLATLVLSKRPITCILSISIDCWRQWVIEGFVFCFECRKCCLWWIIHPKGGVYSELFTRHWRIWDNCYGNRGGLEILFVHYFYPSGGSWWIIDIPRWVMYWPLKKHFFFPPFTYINIDDSLINWRKVRVV